jgi:Ankyrin repeat
MRDEHLGRFHQEEALRVCTLEKPDANEIQPLLFDLVKADKVDVVKTLLSELNGLPDSTKHELRKLAARSGSPAMVDLIVPFRENEFEKDFLRCSIQGGNMENFKYLLSRSKNCTTNWGSYSWSRSYSGIASAVLVSDSEEMFEEWEKYVDIEFKTSKTSQKRPVGARYIKVEVIRATAGHPNREQLLLLLWRKVDLYKSCGNKCLGDALVNVALTTCSVKLAEFLIKGGAKVDHRRSPQCLTPLHHAARQTTVEAAEMMKFLLFCGADPKTEASRANLRIQDEKGAKGISKWLGMSWEDLVTKAKEERQKTTVE